MQGKFQLEIVNNVGHCIHEEMPKYFATKIMNYIERNQFMKMWNLNSKLRKK